MDLGRLVMTDSPKADSQFLEELRALRARVSQLETEAAETRHTVAALEESQAHFRQMADSIHEVFWLFDWTAQRVLYVSPAFEEVWGRPVQELYDRYQAWGESLHPEDIASAEESFARIVDTGGGEEREYRIVRPDGSIRWISDRGFAIFGDVGEVSRIAGIAEDVTSRKQTEEALRASERNYREIFNSVNEMIFVHDAKTGRIVDLNSTVAKTFGYTVEEARQLDLDEFFSGLSPYTMENASRLVREAACKEPQVFEWQCRRKDGTLFWAEVNLKPAMIGGTERILAVARDISERRDAAEALRRAHADLERKVENRTAELARANERFRSIFESTADCILVWDEGYNYLYANQAAIDHVGTTRDKVVGKNMRDGLGHVPDFMQLWMSRVDQVFTTGKPLQVEDSIHVGDRLVHSESILSPIRDGEGRLFAVGVVYRDVTERKQASDKLAAEQQLLRKLFLLGERERKLVAHEIHDGFVQDIVAAKMMLDAAQAKVASANHHAAEDLTEVGRLLRNGIVEARRMIGELRPMIIDEQGIIQAINYLVAEELKQGDTEYRFDHRVGFDRLDPILEGTMFRVVQEALANVRRHSRAEHVVIRMAQGGQKIRMEIEDDGVGFEPTQLPSDRFGVRGICERARLFGGRADVISAPGKGTMIAVEFPVAEAIGSLTPGILELEDE
jgi:PAS domain S-box-containing protein